MHVLSPQTFLLPHQPVGQCGFQRAGIDMPWEPGIASVIC